MKLSLLSRLMFCWLSLFSIFPAEARQEWVWQNPLPQGNHLYSVHFADPLRGIAVGEVGAILTTSDGGVTWFRQPRVTTQLLKAVYMTSALSAVAVGDSGTILRTMDGGVSWLARPGGGAANLNGVRAVGQSRLMVAGDNGTVLKSIDGGMNWSTIPTGVTNNLTAIAYIDSVTATVVGNSAVILRTTDGGASWLTQAGAGFGYLAVCFLDRNRGVVTGYDDLVIATSDGGEHWIRQELPPNTEIDHVWAVALIDSLRGTVTSTTGGFDWMYRTSNGGDTWKLKQYGTWDGLRSLQYVNETMGMAVGEAGRIMRSSDAGVTWNSQSVGISYPLRGISFSDPLNGSAVGFSTIMRTTDGGATWVDQSNRTIGLSLENVIVSDVDMVDAQMGIAVGESGLVLRTTDGGTNWIGQLYLAHSQGLAAVSMQNSTTGIIVGDRGAILRTSDGGVSWQEMNPGATDPLVAVSFPSSTVGFTVGHKIMKTTNGGGSWVSQLSPTAYGLYGVSFATNDTGIAVGLYGTVIRTTNGGANWQLVSSGTAEDLYDVAMIDSRHAIAVGAYGTVRQTTNSGETWTEGMRETRHGLWKISALDTATITVVGDHGAIISTRNQGTMIIPPAPLLASPADNTTNLTTTPDFKWYGSVGASFYRFQASRDSTFTVLDHNIPNIMALQTSLIDLWRDTVYYWRVNAGNVLGEGDFSTTWSFRTTALVPDVPKLLSPEDGATGLFHPIILNWDTVAGWKSFELQIDLDSTFAPPIIDASGMQFTSTWFLGFLPNTDYYWRVRAFTVIGGSEFSRPWKFTTLALPPPPQLIAPQNGAAVPLSRSVFDWSDVPEALQYQLEISETPDFLSLFWWNSVVGSSVEVAGFFSGRTYYWRVRSWNNAGLGPFSPPWSFDVNFPTGVERINGGIPEDFQLRQNFPNPFNSTTTIEFALKEPGHSVLEILNILGEAVETLVERNLDAGMYRTRWNTTGRSSGIYFCRLRSGNYVQTRKIILLR